MRPLGIFHGECAMIAFLFVSLGVLTQGSEPAVGFRATSEKGRYVVAQLPVEIAAKLPMGRLSQEQGEAVLTVALIADNTKRPGPPMLGKYERSGERLFFSPRFPFDAERTYRATLHVGKPISVDDRVPPAGKQMPPRVVKIYPTADVLPANHLKFYIYFDRPMRGGKEIFKQIVLVDDKGKVIDDPWLLDEIWDEENNCLIIYIHPGRIKWGVLLRELLGPVLVEKREYALAIRGTMADPAGNKIGKDHVKKFRTTAEDRVRIDLAQWKLASPQRSSRESLALTLPKSIDHRSLQSGLTVIDAKGQRIDGAIAIGKDEMLWQFTPAREWQRGAYYLEIKRDLEDVAGNTPVRPFDLDLKTPKLAPQNLRFEFQAR